MKKAKKFGNMIDPESEDFQIDQWPFYGIVRLAGRYHLRLDAVLKPINMDVPRWRVLMILATGEPATVTEISEIAVTKMSTMAKIIQRMVSQKLVVTRTAADDGRSTEVLITSEGQRVRDLIRSKVARVSKQAFQDISETELRALNHMTRKVFDNLSP